MPLYSIVTSCIHNYCYHRKPYDSYYVFQLFERRARTVREGKEARFWSDITADMMSDEEKVGNSYVRHPPAYRSKKLNDFISKLDQRSAKGSSHPRKKRISGSPRECTVPSNAKSWMIHDQCSAEAQPSLTPNSDNNDNIATSGEESDQSSVY